MLSVKKTGICEKSKVPDKGGVILIPFQFTRVWEALVPRKEAVDNAPVVNRGMVGQEFGQRAGFVGL